MVKWVLLGLSVTFVVACGGTTNTGGRGISGSGGAVTGGWPGSGGGSSGGSSGAGGPGTGGSSGGASTGGAGSGGTSSGGASPGGAGGDGSGGDSANLCGGVPCLPTRCAGIGCGPAVCCPSASGPVCIHGATTCPESDAGAQRESLACWSQSGSADFAKGCAKASDCFVAQHYAGCCHIEAVGLNVGDQTAFDAFEQTCGGAPPCGCCCDRVITEDGTSTASGASITVDCIGGLCATRSP